MGLCFQHDFHNAQWGIMWKRTCSFTLVNNLPMDTFFGTVFFYGVFLLKKRKNSTWPQEELRLEWQSCWDPWKWCPPLCGTTAPTQPFSGHCLYQYVFVNQVFCPIVGHTPAKWLTGEHLIGFSYIGSLLCLWIRIIQKFLKDSTVWPTNGVVPHIISNASCLSVITAYILKPCLWRGAMPSIRFRMPCFKSWPTSSN